jgi:hypothetical protein
MAWPHIKAPVRRCTHRAWSGRASSCHCEPVLGTTHGIQLGDDASRQRQMHRCKRDLAAADGCETQHVRRRRDGFPGRVQAPNARGSKRLEAACTASLGDILVGSLRYATTKSSKRRGAVRAPAIAITWPNPWTPTLELSCFSTLAARISRVSSWRILLRPPFNVLLLALEPVRD